MNVGNPDEFTLLELAGDRQGDGLDVGDRLFEALPEDDPQQRRPDITRRDGDCSAGRPRCRSGTACSAPSRTPGSRSWSEAARTERPGAA